MASPYRFPPLPPASLSQNSGWQQFNTCHRFGSPNSFEFGKQSFPYNSPFQQGNTYFPSPPANNFNVNFRRPRPDSGLNSFSSIANKNYFNSPISQFNPNFHNGFSGNNEEPFFSSFNKRPRFNTSSQFQQTKREKFNKRDLPENNRFFCDTCSRGFAKEALLAEHIQQHEKCRVDGCHFEGAPKLVNLHFLMQHRSGLAKKIPWLDTPTDIAKWREERKKNFPTAGNVAKKKQLEAEKHARGEVLETKQFREKRQWNKRSYNGQFRRNRYRTPYNRHSGHQIPNEQVKDDPSADPLSYCLDNSGKVPLKPVGVDTSDIKLGGALGSLVSAYGDDSDNQEDSSDTPQLAKADIRRERRQQRKKSQPWFTKDLMDLVRIKTLMVQKAKASEKPEDWLAYRKARNQATAAFRLARKAYLENNHHECNLIVTKKRNEMKKKSGFKQGGSLLEKLLAPEIRNERNIILQCIRYCIENNFLDVVSQAVEIEVANSVPVEKELDQIDVEKPL